MTERLYYHDSYLTRFSAPLASADSDNIRVRLRQTAFYPESGGQPADRGAINGIPVIDVIEEEDGDVVHLLERPIDVRPGEIVEGTIDRQRRFDHVQQHTGQHLLSAVLIELFGFETLSFHMGPELSTIEIRTPSLDAAAIETAELRCNALIAENRTVTVSFETAEAAAGLRKASSREGQLRIVSIDGLDRSACGGTHVRSTGEIGCILLRSTERIRGNTRLSFVCGLRAVRAARAEYNALSSIARTFSSTLADTPRLVAATLERLSAADKERAKLAGDVAAIRGRELHASTPPLASGIRIAAREYTKASEETRAEATAFTGCGSAVLIGVSTDPPAVMLFASADSGIHAGNLLKTALAEHGGRGGGSATAAQGSAPDAGLARAIAGAIEAEVRRTAERR